MDTDYKYEYDEYHQLIAIRDFFGREIVKYRYDLLGNITGVCDDTGWTWYAYDRMSRLAEARYPDGTTEKNTFDPEGNITSYTDRIGRTWRYRYKARQQMIKMIAPDGGAIKYDYTLADELCEVIDPNGNRTEYIHDLCDEVIAIRHNGFLVESYENDPEGRLLGKKDSRGNFLAAFTFDTGDEPVIRVIKRADKKVESQLRYDKHEQLLFAKDEFAEIERDYDPRGRIISERLNGHEVSHKYDEEGRLLQTIFEDDVEFRLSYDGDAVTVTDPNGNEHTWYSDGVLIVERWLASGIEESFEYDEDDRVVRHGLSGVKGTKAYLDKGRTIDLIARKQDREIGVRGVYFDRRYIYDAEGQLTRMQDGKDERFFEYDACGRLIKIGIRRSNSDDSRIKECFAYDLGGNLFPSENGLKARVQSGNQLVEWGDRQFAYDHEGHLASESRGQDRYAYTYDSIEQLVSVNLPDGRVAVYEYDALRRRVSKLVGDEKTIFGWDGDRLSWEIGTDGIRRYYFYAGSDEYSPVMFCDVRVLPGGERRFETYFVHYDQSNRPLLITDYEAKIVWSADISAYGKTSVDQNSAITYNLRAPGQYYDFETGFHYNHHRYYDAEIGRYTQPDLIGLAGGLNLYSYGDGNPLVTCDILGLAST